MDVVLRAVLIYLFVLLLLRVTTRRIIRSATAADMVLVFVFGGFAIQFVLGDQRSMVSALLALVTVSLSHLSVQSLSNRWRGFGHFASGSPAIIYAGGEWDWGRMKDLRVQEEDILSEMRQRGMRRIEDVDTIVIEHNGGISVMARESGG
jgi:uncharacterized membrane protein YcaP (DUF421 family)